MTVPIACTVLAAKMAVVGSVMVCVGRSSGRWPVWVGDGDQCDPPLMQFGPSASWPVVLVPMGGPWMMVPVSTERTPPETDMAKRSRPRGAGPPFFSPTWLYWLPWQGHSNHWEVTHSGTRQPRWTHFW